MLSLTVSRVMTLSPARLYRAWTAELWEWFAEPTDVQLRAEQGAPFYFRGREYVFDDGHVCPRVHYYGRFVQLVRPSLVAFTWIAVETGGQAHETLVTVTLTPQGSDTLVTVTQDGHPTNERRDKYERVWQTFLAMQDAAMSEGDAVHDPEPLVLPRNRSMPDAVFIPVRSYPDPEAAVAWLSVVLGCRERLRVPGHRVQLTVGTGAVVVAAWDPTTAPATGGRPPAVLMVRVPDVDAAFARGVAMGATPLSPPSDQPYGERQASLRDPAGHAWTLTQTIADVDPKRWGGELVP